MGEVAALLEALESRMPLGLQLCLISGSIFLFVRHAVVVFIVAFADVEFQGQDPPTMRLTGGIGP